MRAKIQRRTARTPPKPVEMTPEDVVSPDDEILQTTPANGLDPHSDPPIPPPRQPSQAELVQAVLRLIQRVDALERGVGGLAQQESVQRDALERNTRHSAVTTAISFFEKLYPGGIKDFGGEQARALDAVAQLTAYYLNYFTNR